MFSLILILLLIMGLFIGLKRGLVLQLLHLSGFIIAFIVAASYYKKLGNQLELWIPYASLSDQGMWADFLRELPLEAAFYQVIAFAIIFFGVKIILQMIASMLDIVAALPLLNSVNKLLGAVFGFIEIYLILFILLYIMALTPIETIQYWINYSSVALFILEQTPYFSNKLFDLLFNSIIKTQI